MASKKCFKHNCDFEVMYICKCSGFETFSCDLHFVRHLKLENRVHSYEFILSEPDEEKKEYFGNEKLKKQKKNVLTYKSKGKYKDNLKRKNIEYNPAILSNSLEESTYAAYKNSKIEQESRRFNLQLDIVKENRPESKLINEKKLKKRKSNAFDEEIDINIPLLDFQLSTNNSKKWNMKSIIKEQEKAPISSLSSQDLNIKISMLWSQGNNPEAELDFRRICSFYKSGETISDPVLKQAYKDYIYAYHKIASLHYFECNYRSTQLHIYDTENKTEEIKLINTPENLEDHTCIAQLPNGELFCYGQRKKTGIALIIDRNFNIRMLPNGPRCYRSSAIYYNRNIYCFGGDTTNAILSFSARFDLDKNLWLNLASLPEANFDCHSVIFNENIVICGTWTSKIWVYSLDIDSFSQAPYAVERFLKKMLVSTDRLYLIEFALDKYIHESEIGNAYVWKKIGNSKLDDIDFRQYYTYNKGAIYILGNDKDKYWKFGLNKKIMTRVKLR